MTRLATPADTVQILFWLGRFHVKSHYSGVIPFDAVSMRRTILSLIEQDNSVIFIHKHGVIGGILAPFFFNDDNTQAIEMFWYAERDGRALFNAFEKWAEAKGADAIVMGSVKGDRQRTVNAIYRRKGYVEGEHLHMRAI